MAHHASHGGGGSHHASHGGSHHASHGGFNRPSHSSSHHTSHSRGFGAGMFPPPQPPRHHTHMPPPPPPRYSHHAPPPVVVVNNNQPSGNYNYSQASQARQNYSFVPATAKRCRSKENWRLYSVSGQTFEQYLESNNFRGTWYDNHSSAFHLDMQDPYIKENYKPAERLEKISKAGMITVITAIIIKILYYPIVEYIFGSMEMSDALFYAIDDFVYYSPWVFMILGLVINVLFKSKAEKKKRELAVDTCNYYDGQYELYGENSTYDETNMF